MGQEMIEDLHKLLNSHVWFPAVFWRDIKRLITPQEIAGVRHIIFCLADHYEPRWNNVDQKTEMRRIMRWVEKYPVLANMHRDSNGRPVQHSWFYAAEEYRSCNLEEISKLCGGGFGEIELHLHHDNDTPQGFRLKLEEALANFTKHGALITQENPPRHAFGFIHGNWALNNSGAHGRNCGVNNELKILKECGCYADFTLPSAPDASQTSKVNAIYYAEDIPNIRKSHNTGTDIRAGGKAVGDLVMIQGPLALNWKRRKYGFLPRIENGCVHQSCPPTPNSIDLWVRQHIHVVGRPEWTFIKVHCHGTQENDEDVLLGERAHTMYSYLEKTYNDGKRYQLHYVTAREMYNIVKAAEDGKEGNPIQFKDYVITPYKNTGKS